MDRRLTAILLLLLPGVFAGCSICCAPHDYDYPAVGGKHQRVDPQYGRVGSVFSDPQAVPQGPGPDSNLRPHPTGSDFDEDYLEEIRPQTPIEGGSPEDVLPGESDSEEPAVRRTSYEEYPNHLR